MLLEEYQQQVTRTLPDLGSYQLNIIHMILGLNAEFDELYEAKDEINHGEELMDINWYLCNYCNLNNIQLSQLSNFLGDRYFLHIHDGSKRIFYLQSQISKLTDLEKKLLAYKKEIIETKRIEAVVNIFQALSDCFVFYKLNPFIFMQRNIDKLRARYPEKFDESLAKNRDLIKERKILEGND